MILKAFHLNHFEAEYENGAGILSDVAANADNISVNRFWFNGKRSNVVQTINLFLKLGSSCKEFSISSVAKITRINTSNNNFFESFFNSLRAFTNYGLSEILGLRTCFHEPKGIVRTNILLVTPSWTLRKSVSSVVGMKTHYEKSTLHSHQYCEMMVFFPASQKSCKQIE